MGLDKAAHEAASLWALDSTLPQAVLNQVSAAKDVTRACTVTIVRQD
jgi:hypothetical protein